MAVPSSKRSPVALVTGAAVRLGRHISEGLLADGFDLVVHTHRSKIEAQALVDHADRMGRRAFILVADFFKEEEVLELAEKAQASWGRIDVLVNSAAIFHPTSASELTGAELEAFLKINLKAPYLLASRLGPCMKASGRGVIINIDCLSAEKPWPNYLPYSISKAGLRSLTLGLAQLLAPEVRVNGIAPGTVLPPVDTSKKALKEMAENALLKRIGQPEDILRAVRYLIASDFVTGEILTVDGGLRYDGKDGSR